MIGGKKNRLKNSAAAMAALPTLLFFTSALRVLFAVMNASRDAASFCGHSGKITPTIFKYERFLLDIFCHLHPPQITV